jgi:hypothetical protein
MKTCTKCFLQKPLSEFYKIHHNKHYMSECKSCFKSRARNHYLNNKEKYNTAKLNWIKNNRERYNKQMSDYRQNHREITNLRANISDYKKKLNIIEPRTKYGTCTIKKLQLKLTLLKKLHKLDRKINSSNSQTS